MHYNNRVYVYINKIVCNKNKVKSYSGIKPKNKVLPLVEEKCPLSVLFTIHYSASHEIRA